jgi:hypothetical protein
VRKVGLSAAILAVLFFVGISAAFGDSVAGVQDSLLVLTGPGSGGVGNVGVDAVPFDGDSSTVFGGPQGSTWSVSETGLFGNGSTDSAYGQIVVTLTAATTGTYDANMYFNDILGTPGYNEFATAAGTLAAGESYEAGVPGSTSAPAANTVENDVATLAVLNNTNSIPGGTSNYLDNCTGPTCNGTVGVGLGLAVSLSAGDSETFTFDVSNTAPAGGFYVDQTHPADGNNPTQLDAFFSATAASGSNGGGNNGGGGNGGGTNVPEPGAAGLLAVGLAALGFFSQRRKSFSN